MESGKPSGAKKEITAGVFCVYAPEDASACFLGFSPNVEGMWKRLLFELRLNACPYRQLQLFWNQQEQELQMEMLQALEGAHQMEVQEQDEALRQMLVLQQQRLGATAHLIQAF